jgi:predicted AlkP superfamily phosphohydrolase/phosphomutase
VSILKRFFRRGSQEERVLVLGLEGVGLEFAQGLAQRGVMPNLGRLLSDGQPQPVDTVLPAVAEVAWATYATGANPGRHGVFGFVDREPNPFETHFPDANDLKVPPLWEILGRAGKRVGVMNLPLTFPPKPVTGFLVSGYGAPELGKATFPVELAPRLLELDYRIAADNSLAKSDTSAYLADAAETLGRRFTAAFQLMQSEAWDYFHLHIMGTYFLNYLLWADYQEGGEGLAAEFSGFYQRLDSYLGELAALLPGGSRLVAVSDYGFAPVECSLFVNRWLEENGYLLFGRGKRDLRNLHPDSRAYSLVPGRVYVNLKGREERGSVERGKAYEDLREELSHRLAGLVHPESNQPLIRKVHRREELYSGSQVARAADLVIEPAAGVELKANLGGPGVVGPPEAGGVPVAQGAFAHFEGIRQLEGEGPLELTDLAPTVLGLLGVAPPASMEGRPRL